jgi:predicted dehydrogenase
MATISDLKIAFVGVCHWHAPLFFPAVRQANLNVVAVADGDEVIANKHAKTLGCKAYTDAGRLMDVECPDFVFAFGKHSEMAGECIEIIERGIPFSIEKPVGLTVEEVRNVKDLADKKGLFCSSPLIWRYSKVAHELKKNIKSEDIIDLSFKFIVGPPQRYLANSPWMLDPSYSGGGCITNTAQHFWDMAFYLTESDKAEVLASIFHYTNDYPIEDYGSIMLRMSSGASVTIHMAFAFPQDEVSLYNQHWEIATKKGYYMLGDNKLETRLFNKESKAGPADVTIVPVCTFNDYYFPVYVRKTLQEYADGNPPTVGLKDMLRSREILDEVIKKAKECDLKR